MRIAVLIDFYPPENRGGAGIVARRLNRHFADEGHEILVVATTAGEPATEQVEEAEVVRLALDYPERFRNYRGIQNPPALPLVGEQLRRFRPDVVHAHNVHHYLSFGALGVADELGFPVVLTSHDYLMVCCGRLTCTTGPTDLHPRQLHCLAQQRFRYNPLRRGRIRRLVNRHVGRVLAISDVMHRALALNGFHSLETVHNGIDPVEWPANDPAPADSGKADAPLVVLPARLSAEKGTEALLDAVALLPAPERPRILFAGDNPRYQPALGAYAARLGLGDRIEISGWVDQARMVEIFRSADIVVTPSTYPDPFNLGNIEAMASNRPVIASAFGGGPEIVRDGETGYVVDPNDTPLFARRLAALVGDPDLRAAMGAAGRRRVLESFTLTRQAEAVMAAYERAIAAR
jgi:glycosyltransferase involved in cell wall biosynthesis